MVIDGSFSRVTTEVRLVLVSEAAGSELLRADTRFRLRNRAFT